MHFLKVFLIITFSMLYDKDAGHLTFMDDVYECQSRNIPGGSWGPASRPWADVVSLCVCLCLFVCMHLILSRKKTFTMFI